MITRRSMLLGLTASLIAAPAVIRTPGLLMKIVVPKPEWLISWGPSTIYAEGMPPHVMESLANEVYWDNADDSFRKLVVQGADWPYRTFKAPPGGFKIARS